MTLIRPTSLEAALSALAGLHPATTTIVAGGTDVMVEVTHGDRTLADVVAVRGVPELTRLRREPDLLRVGAAVSYTRLTDGSVLPAGVLLTAAATMGSTQIRNGGTIGGNVGTASSVSDSLCALLALGARATVAGAGGMRTLPISELIRPEGGSALGATDLLIDLEVPLPSGHQRFLKVTRRGAVSRSVVSVSAVLTPDAAEPARIVIGGCAPAPIRVAAAERLAAAAWDGSGLLDPDAADAVGTAVAEAIDPLTDLGGSADYRRHVARVLTRRALTTVSSRSLTSAEGQAA